MKKTRFVRALFCVLTLLFACAVFTGCEKKPKKLVMATNAQFPPYEYYDGSRIVGIDAEIAGEIAADLGCDLEIVNMPFNSVLEAVKTGKADIGLSAITVNDERLRDVSFSVSYVKAAQVVIVKEDSSFSSASDLLGKRVGAKLNTTGDKCAQEIADVSITRFSKSSESVEALLQDKVDAVVMDSDPAKVFVSQNEGLRILDKPLKEEEYAVAVAKKNKTLLNNINNTIGNLKSSGKLQSIIDEYSSAE